MRCASTGRTSFGSRSIVSVELVAPFCLEIREERYAGIEAVAHIALRLLYSCSSFRG